ncbi:MAG: NAD-binding protein, partial [Candidatus Thermoplasmatota archaeon]|nr:NAD-binding protein [Candidatus Thermoplasmatota archaeon]
KVLVVGGGDLAFDNALGLHENRAYVTLIHRSSVKANSMLVDEVQNAGIEMIKGDPGDIDRIDGGYRFRDIIYHTLAVFIGRSPKLDLLEGLEHFKTYLPSFRTSVKGLYVIGDAALGTLGQTALSSGSGLAAAMDIAKMVKKDESALREGT